MLRAIIIDDEHAGIATLKMLLEKNSTSIKVVASAIEAEDGITLIEDYKPEVVFLDISMPTMSGFELLDKLTYRDFKLVFITAHEEYALQAIKNKAFDYLLKPIDIPDLKKCITNIEKEIENKPRPLTERSINGLIELSVKDGIIYIRQQDIVRLEAAGSYTVFYLEGNIKHMASKNIKEYESHLNPAKFFRCHQSHIVNLKKVVKFLNHEGFFAQMNDGSTAIISKKSKDHFLEKLKTI